MPPNNTRPPALTLGSSVRTGVYIGTSDTSCPRAINSAASPLSRKQLPQYIPAAPAVIDRIFMTLPFQVPGSGFQVRVQVPVRGSRCAVQGSARRSPNLEPRTVNLEPEP